MKFIHHFNRNLQVEMTVSDEPPIKGTSHVQNIEWTGQPKLKYTNEYRQWVLAVNQRLCETWQQSILYALGTKPNETEFWGFEPGKAPKLLKKVPLGI